jgi:hypothetical protein
MCTEQEFTQGRRGKYSAEEKAANKAAIEAEKQAKRRKREEKSRKLPANCKKVDIKCLQ